MKRVILCPNPYRDSELKVAKRSKEILERIGFETVVCLPFSREGYDDQLGVPIRQLQQEIKRADLLIAFGGDGTILHLARTVALHSVPVLGINLGSLGFMSELEQNELERLHDLKNWDFNVESRMMLDVTVLRDGKPVYNNIALNDGVISKGSVARVGLSLSPRPATCCSRPSAPTPRGPAAMCCRRITPSPSRRRTPIGNSSTSPWTAARRSP